MIILFYFFLTFKIFATLICAFYCWRISRLDHTPTTTYVLFCIAFTLRFLTQLQGIFYTRDILGFLSGYPAWLIIESQLVEAIIAACFLIAILKKFSTYKTLPIIKPDGLS